MKLGAYKRTIGSIAYEAAPPPLRDFGKTDLNLDFTYNEAGLFRVDLTLQRLKIQYLFAIFVENLLEGFRVIYILVHAFCTYTTLLEFHVQLSRVCATVKNGEDESLFSFIKLVSGMVRRQ